MPSHKIKIYASLINVFHLEFIMLFFNQLFVLVISHPFMFFGSVVFALVYVVFWSPIMFNTGRKMIKASNVVGNKG